MASSRVFGACGRALMAAAKGAATTTGGGAAAKKAASGGGAAAKTAATTKSRSNSAILKVVPVSSQLGSFLGAPQASRSDAVKKIWEYIKLHNLQNPTNKKEIICDEKLKTIFNGKDTVGFTEIARLLSNHFVKSG